MKLNSNLLKNKLNIIIAFVMSVEFKNGIVKKYKLIDKTNKIQKKTMNKS